MGAAEVRKAITRPSPSRRSTASGAPPFVSYNGGSPGFLGPVFQPYRPSGKELRLHRSISADRLKDRTALLGELDNIRRDIDHSGQLTAIDSSELTLELYESDGTTLIARGAVAGAASRIIQNFVDQTDNNCPIRHPKT